MTLPKGMSEGQIRSMLIARRRSLTQQLMEAKSQQRAINARIDKLEAELAEVDDGERVLNDEMPRR